MKSCALYIHIPFCTKKCAYCDFASWAGRNRDWARYLNGLEDEFAAAHLRYGKMPVGSVFIGGGTPSILAADAVQRILAMTRARFELMPEAEVTVEANPGTLSPEKLRAYRDSGVNRLSVGVQAVQSGLLQMLGRIHDGAEAARSIEWARAAGFSNISLDLMYALPGQTMAQWVETLRFALELRPQHLSLYSLILEAGTPLARAAQRGKIAAASDQMALDMQRAAQRILSRRGYARYEISNYALSGYECRHNMAYWTRGDYLGLGCAAHSMMRGERFENTSDLDQYLSGVREVARRAISAEEAAEEAVMLGTRTVRGIPVSWVGAGRGRIERLEAGGFIRLEGGRLALTDKGMEVQNAVVLELLAARP
jgi:oxygen-independent coproporphyrinogen-3 oxidase